MEYETFELVSRCAFSTFIEQMQNVFLFLIIFYLI